MAIIHLTAEYSAAPLSVFEFFLDHDKFGSIWAGQTTRIKDANAENPNDVGSVRSIKVGFSTIQEQQMVAERPADERPGLIEYKVIKGGAITDHLGHIEFHPTATGGTRIQYSIMLKMAVPGLAHVILRGIKKQWVEGSAAIAPQLSQ